jgi:acyl-coenzyme A thioesterase PaaI-like protein
MMQRLRTWLWRWRFNLFPAYFGSGARVTSIASDWREVRVTIPLSWRTRNYVGTMFGGSMYAAVDPIYMMMLIQVLGPGYVVWDKAASIRFRKPGNGTLYAVFRLPEREIDAIRSALEVQPSVDRQYHIDLLDNEGMVRATVEKTLYIRKSEAVALPRAA